MENNPIRLGCAHTADLLTTQLAIVPVLSITLFHSLLQMYAQQWFNVRFVIRAKYNLNHRSMRYSSIRLVILLGLISLHAGAQHATDPTSLSLHDAIRLAQTSAQARSGQDEVDVVRGTVLQAGLSPNPRLYLQSEDLRPWARDFSFANSTEEYGYLGQLFELGGKRGRRVDLAMANLRQTEANRQLLNQQIAGRVAAAYWSAVVSDGVVQSLHGDLQAVDQIVLYNKERVDAGAMRGVDLIRTEIERDRLRLALETARRDAALNRIDLFRQIGTGPDVDVKLSDSIDAVGPVKAEALSVVLASRADVTAARESLAAAEADTRLQRAVAVPDLDLLCGIQAQRWF